MNAWNRRPLTDILGRTFGRLTPVSEAPQRGKRRYIRCQCACGQKRTVELSALLTGNSKSCGCWNRDLNRFVHRTHGESYSPEYKIWLGIKKRCTDPNSVGFRLYGGRGIRLYKKWLHDFPAYLAYTGRRPSPLHSIDRWPNPNGHYEPGNVRWATPREQANNSSRNHHLTYDGQTLTVAEWATELGMHYTTLMYRIRVGWTIADALTLSLMPGVSRRKR